MKGKMKKVRLRYEPPTRFEVRPVPAAPFRGTQETGLDVLKARLLLELLKGTADTDLYPRLRRAANDAAAVAWTTPFPLLVFPTLLDEKAREAEQRHNHQQAVLARSRRLMKAAA
jgi:hypothetical protein